MTRSNANTKTKNETKAYVRRKHDPFFRYIYAVPENARALLRLSLSNDKIAIAGLFLPKHPISAIFVRSID